MNWSIISAVLMPKNGCPLKMLYRTSELKRNKVKKVKTDRVGWSFSTLLSNDPGEVDSSFFCYAATVLSPHRNVLIFTQRMHKPTRRPFTQ